MVVAHAAVEQRLRRVVCRKPARRLERRKDRIFAEYLEATAHAERRQPGVVIGSQCIARIANAAANTHADVPIFDDLQIVRILRRFVAIFDPLVADERIHVVPSDERDRRRRLEWRDAVVVIDNPCRPATDRPVAKTIRPAIKQFDVLGRVIIPALNVAEAVERIDLVEALHRNPAGAFGVQ